MKNPKRIAAGLSIALWIGAFFLPAFEGIPGYWAAAIGFLGLLTGAFGWFANLLWLVCLIYMILPDRLPLFWAVPAQLLALTALAGVKTASDVSIQFHEPRIGAFVWIASFAPMLAVSILEAAVHYRTQAAKSSAR